MVDILVPYSDDEFSEINEKAKKSKLEIKEYIRQVSLKYKLEVTI